MSTVETRPFRFKGPAVVEAFQLTVDAARAIIDSPLGSQHGMPRHCEFMGSRQEKHGAKMEVVSIDVRVHSRAWPFGQRAGLGDWVILTDTGGAVVHPEVFARLYAPASAAEPAEATPPPAAHKKRRG